MRNIILFGLIFLELQAQAQDGASSSNRATKSFMVVAQPVGFGPIPSMTNGLILGYFAQPDLILQLELCNGFRFNYSGTEQKDENGNGSSTSSIAWRSEFWATSVGVHAKYFLGNSFFVKGGLDYRNIRQGDIFYTTSTERTYEFNGRSLSVAVAIGNQWQFSWFTHGIDIVGIVLPISHSVSETFPASPTTYGQGRTRDGEDAYLKASSAILARYYLGASF
ncbi:MAG: hypothetical protein ABL958_01510 [Bdellovibrionia bacterium]